LAAEYRSLMLAAASESNIAEASPLASTRGSVILMKALAVAAAFAAFVFATSTVAEAAAAACAQMCSAGCSKRYPGGGASFDRCKERCYSLKCNR